MPPGWYVTLHGEACDLRTWSRELADAAVGRLLETPQDLWLLTSARFARCQGHDDVRTLTEPLVDDLNVTMAEEHATLPLNVTAIVLIRADGVRHYQHCIYHSLQPRDQVAARGIYKNELDALPLRDRVHGLLVQLVEARDGAGIYRTLELAEQLVGGQGTLRTLSGDERSYRRFREWANAFRHPTVPYHVPAEIPMVEALGRLRSIVRIALGNKA